MLRKWLTSLSSANSQKPLRNRVNRGCNRWRIHPATQFDLLEPRILLATSTSSINAFEGETAYIQIDVDKHFEPRSSELVVMATSGSASRDVDYSVETDSFQWVSGAFVEVPIHFLADSLNEGSEDFELSVQLHLMDRSRLRNEVIETTVFGTVSDRVVSISVLDEVASEVPPNDPEFDTATLRVSRENGSVDLPMTVYLIANDFGGSHESKNVADQADWSWKEAPRVAGFKTYLDTDTQVELETPVYAIDIPKGEKHVDLIVHAGKDHDFELDEKLTFELVEEFQFDRHGVSQTQKALYELGSRKASVTISDRTADIDINSLDEVKEDAPGFLLPTNNDDDNGDGIPDYLNADENDKFVDDDLIQVSIRSLIPDGLDFTRDYFTLDFDETDVRFWHSRDKSVGPDGKAEITLETQFTEESDHTIWIEGVGWGAGSVKLIWHNGDPLQDQSFKLDSIAYSLFAADLDIDSDNDGIIQHSDWEDQLENNRYGLGKLIEEFDRTQVHLRVPAAAFDPKGSVRFVFDYKHKSNSGTIWLSKSFPRDVFTEEDRILPGVEYTLQDLINSSLETLPNGYLPLLVIPWEQANSNGEPLDQLTEIQKLDPEDTIKVTVKAGEQEASDEVKYVITGKGGSIYWEIQNKPDVRAAIASTAVYQLQDLPHAGLEILDRTKEDRLRELGVPDLVIEKLNRLSSDSDQLPKGFTATVYRNYTAGPSSYLIAFAGTNNTELTDWINNASQAVASGSPQYSAAMDVGLGLRLAEGVDELHATGHSLGGGLASAAVVWAGGIQGYTFNAAGLTIDTIKLHQNSFNMLLPLKDRRYATDRYDRIAAGSPEVIAYYNHLDILSVIQDSTEHIPSAIGHRVEIRGKYGNDELKYFDAHHARRVLRILIPKSVSSKDNQVQIDPATFTIELADYFGLEIVFPGTLGVLLETYEQLEMFKSGIDQLIETHSLFDETLLGEFYGESNE